MKIEQIEEWIREVEQRPASAPLIIQYIARRLAELSRRNEDLLAENIALRTEKRVEEYESRIANLEYQLELIKRQVSGIDSRQILPTPSGDICLFVYNHRGMILRCDLTIDQLVDHHLCLRVKMDDADGFIPPRLLVTTPQEELMFMFDSGRLITWPASNIPVCADEITDWGKAMQLDLRSGEELAAVAPIGKMSLFEYAVQISRRGCAKRMMLSAFENYIANQFVGSGAKMKSDKTCCLVFSGRDDRLVLVSQEGYLLTCDAQKLPFTSEEIGKLSATDHIVDAFALAGRQAVIFVTQNRKVISREANWLEAVESFRSRGQAVFSQNRRDAGVRIVGGAAINDDDWGISLSADGNVVCHSMNSLVASGTVTGETAANMDSLPALLSFAVFSAVASS